MTSAGSPEAWNEERFLREAEQFSRMVDEALAAECARTEHVPRLHEGMVYALGLDQEDAAARGKRIRPVLCLMTTRALGHDPAAALPFACAIELLHNFALVHDDIEDGDTQRRGRESVHVRYGLAHGINIGDYMLGRVFRLLHEAPGLKPELRAGLLTILDETLERLFAGQAMDIEARTRPRFTMAEYVDLVDRKTGSYLAAPLLGGALTAGAGEEILDALRRLGSALGPLFQVKDDLIDLTSSKGRGQHGNDIREGKRSYLVAAVAEKASAAGRERLFAILDKPREETTHEDVEAVMALFREHGAVEDAERYCQELQARAGKALAPLPVELAEMLRIATAVLANRKS